MLARAEVCHDSLVDLAGEKAFEASNDLTLGPAVRRAACHVLDGRLVEPPAGARAARRRSLSGTVKLTKTRSNPPQGDRDLVRA